MPSNKPPYLPTSEEREAMPIQPEMYARNRAFQQRVAETSDIPSKYLYADGTLARDVMVVRDLAGNIKRIEDYRS